MDRTPVRSSNIRSIGYDPASATLEVEFTSGVYQYLSVPREVYDRFMTASSKGQFCGQHIKDKYRTVKVR